jgi:hypothetical protein
MSFHAHEEQTCSLLSLRFNAVSFIWARVRPVRLAHSAAKVVGFPECNSQPPPVNSNVRFRLPLSLAAGI